MMDTKGVPFWMLPDDDELGCEYTEEDAYADYCERCFEERRDEALLEEVGR